MKKGKVVVFMGLFRTVGGALIGVVLAPATGGASLLAAAAAGATVANIGGAINDDEKKAKARSEGRKEGFIDGVKAGNIEAAKKFAMQLLQSDNMRIGTFALGLHVATIDGDDVPEEELCVIEDALGRPDSKINSSYVRSEMSKVLNESPDFSKIKQIYLNVLTPEQLQSMDAFVRDVIRADNVIAPEERRFYNNEWAPYLSSRTNMNISHI